MDTAQFNGIYRNKKVLVTGHTGFKGSWLTLWLIDLGAMVHGYALEAPTDPSLFQVLDLEDSIDHEVADIRDFKQLKESIDRIKPDIIFHLAAQSLVRDSYASPLETAETNTLGTIHLMEAVRQLETPVAMVMITSDKCYENREWLHAYRETDPLGGHDPYSSSKAAAEIFISSWRNSFFPPEHVDVHGVRVASARAGNVVGGGDWTKDNLVPDCVRALQQHKTIEIRSPHATRPWQHVLEALRGYLLLGERLLDPVPAKAKPYCEAFNFGPPVNANKTVKEVAEKIIAGWGSGSWRNVSTPHALHEASLLSISVDKAYHRLGWYPKLDFDETMDQTISWYRRFVDHPSTARAYTLQQIRFYQDCDRQIVKAGLPEETSLILKA